MKTKVKKKPKGHGISPAGRWKPKAAPKKKSPIPAELLDLQSTGPSDAHLQKLLKTKRPPDSWFDEDFSSL